ncbi:SH3 domain-containing protein [Merismopedia glauca]|uniref:SH3 domain-containing protein n=1 Tax=Merismopedia glauca CCAP 1448/3 TaxID=1296344 RepID=A0A2T1C342_9CYAN|nr:SH3 domain-containing protein [Merismopedia glauca]PSB02624.1 hypothetical protein C7B64_12305 [Merismopedia glauca CCAP 1448/3]
MSRFLLSTTLSTAIFILPTLSLAGGANAQFPQPNGRGDYYSIQTPGTTSSHLVWQVVSSELNCRSRPGSNSRVVRKLFKGDVINLVSRPKIRRDAKGLPWLFVAKEGSLEDIKTRCFVRGNAQFIKPIPYSFSDLKLGSVLNT